MRIPLCCLCHVLSLAAAVAVQTEPSPTGASGRELVSAASIRALTPQQVRTRPAVKFHGVVTYARHSAITDCTIQDATGGVWLLPLRLPENCRVGAEVEVEGHVEPGGLWPVVQADTVRYLGPGNLPPARAAMFEELLSGMVDSSRVEVTGVVRSQRVNPELDLNWLVLDISSGGGRFTTHITYEITGHPELVGARVKLTGGCLNSADPHRQALLPRLNLHTLADLEVLRPAATRPFDQPVRPLNQILRPTIESESGQRVRVQATVTLQLPGGDFFLQDETRGLQVFPHDPTPLHPGEVVDVIGFPEPGEISPAIRDADWRPVAAKTRMMPLPVAVTEAVEHDGRLLALQGRLVDISRGEREVLLTLESDGVRFTAHVPGQNVAETAKQWRIGSELAVSGVCVAQVGIWERFISERRPQGFQLLLREPADVAILRTPPLSPRVRAAWGLGGLGSVSLATLAFLQVRARRRLREQARERAAARAEFKAVLAERNRMAREIHDTLAQGFVGISTHLEALNDRLHAIGDNSRRHLDTAREIARESLEEARRTVWNMRSQVLETGDLSTALERLGRQLSNGSTTKFEIETSGVARRLSPAVENDLLRIGQEALNNATRHAHATQLKVELDFAADTVRLHVIDNGKGFDLSTAQRKGNFGLVGMRERCEDIGATFRLDSAPGRGTTIEVGVRDV